MPYPTQTADIATLLLNCAYQALLDLDQPLGRVCVVPGIPVDIDCCDGQLTVSWLRSYRYTKFPYASTELGPCKSAKVAAEFMVSIRRCMPQVDDRGNGPSCADLEEAAVRQLSDAVAIMAALSDCPVVVNNRHRGVMVLEQTSYGPEGACVGSDTRVAVEAGSMCLPVLPES